MQQFKERGRLAIATPESGQPTGQPVLLTDYVRQARQNSPDEHPHRLLNLNFLKLFRLPGKATPKDKNLDNKAKKHVRLASGLTIEKVLEVVGGLETALNEFKPGATPYPALAPAEIRVTEAASGLQVTLAGREDGQETFRQREISKLFYWLVTGQELEARSPDTQLRQLAQNFPYTEKVLRQGWQDGYSSTRQLCGAFGWSLFRWEHLPLTDAQIEATRQEPKPVKPAPVKQLELPLPTDNQASNKSGLPALMAVASLAVGLALIVAFLVISAATPPVVAVTPTKAAPSPSPIPSPTAPLGLSNTRQADGANVTRLNPAYLTADQQKYANPDSLAPGQAALLNGQRSVQVVNAQWSLGQNVYLGLQDGGWEVWDTASNNRLSRRELPDMDQYAWVNWSPDGENFAAQGYDGKLRLGTGGRVLRTFAFNIGYSPGEAGFPLSWSPGSNILMVRTEEAGYQFWNFQGGPQPVMTADSKQTLSLKGEPNYNGFPGIWSWSGDSRYIAFFMGSSANSINIYDTRNLAKIASITMDWQAPQQVSEIYSDQYNGTGLANTQGNFAWSPDNRYMALQRWNRNITASNGDGSPLFQRTLTIFELPANLLNRGNNTPVVPPQFQVIKLDSPDSSNLLAWSRNDRLVVNSRTKELVNNAPVVRQNNLLTFDLDVSGNFNWTNSYKLTIPGQPETVNAWWAPDGRRLLVNTNLSYLAVYQLSADWERTQNVQIRSIIASQDNPIEMAVPSPDGRWLTTFSIKTGPQLRDFKTGQLKLNLDGPVNGANGLTFKWSPDSRYLAVVYSWLEGPSYNSHYKTVTRIWDFENYQGGLNDLPKLYGDLLIPNGGSFVPRVDWSPKSEQPQLLFEQNQDLIGSWDLTKTPPGPLADQEKQLFPGKTGVPIDLPIRPSSQPTQTLAFNLVGSTYPRSNNPNFWLAPRAWFPDWQAVVGPLDNTHNYGILKMQPATADKDPVKIQFDPSTEQKPEKATATAVTVSPDGRMIALGFDNGLVQLYDAANGKLFQAFTPHQAAIRELAFSPDSKTLATASDDRTVKVWDSVTWKSKAVLRGQNRPVTFLQWVPGATGGSNTLLVGGTSAVMWRVS